MIVAGHNNASRTCNHRLAFIGRASRGRTGVRFVRTRTSRRHDNDYKIDAGHASHHLREHAAATGTVTIYDNSAASGTKIGTITSYASVPGCFIYDVAFWTGLTIVTATAAPDITVSWR